MPAPSSVRQISLPVSASSARTKRSRLPVKINPPAVTTGPTLGKWPPVSLRSFAASSGTTPSGTCHLICPTFRSYSVMVVHGGEIAESPLLVIMKPNSLR